MAKKTAKKKARKQTVVREFVIPTAKEECRIPLARNVTLVIPTRKVGCSIKIEET